MMIMMKEHEKSIMEALGSGKVCIISANCSIEYNGRITSTLDYGDRIIMVKKDRSVIVHKPKGIMPINYMKEKSDIKVTTDENEIVMKVTSIKNKEAMTIFFSRIMDVQSFVMVDDNQILLNGTERDMSDMIMEKPSLIDNDFVPLSREEHTRFGFIDVYGHDSKKNLVVVECKRSKADYHAIVQLKRYTDRIRHSKGIPDEKMIRGVIAAPAISEKAGEYLKTLGFEYRKVQPPERVIKEKSQSVLGEFK
jgi:endonuclease